MFSVEHPQPDGDGICAPGQIGERALVSAGNALGPPAAERAACRDPARLKGEGNYGGTGIEDPGFEPSAGMLRHTQPTEARVAY